MGKWESDTADTVSKALEILNQALTLDPDAMTRLVNLRVECNAGLAAHPTILIGAYDGIAKVGVLGLINGIIGNSPTGVIGAKGRIDTNTGHFTHLSAFVDLREEKVDVIA